MWIFVKNLLYFFDKSKALFFYYFKILILIALLHTSHGTKGHNVTPPVYHSTTHSEKSVLFYRLSRHAGAFWPLCSAMELRLLQERGAALCNVYKTPKTQNSTISSVGRVHYSLQRPVQRSKFTPAVQRMRIFKTVATELKSQPAIQLSESRAHMKTKCWPLIRIFYDYSE